MVGCMASRLLGRGAAVTCMLVTVLLVAAVPAAAAETVTVEEAVGRALGRSPAVQAAVFGTSAAAARQRAARAAYTPQISAKGEIGRSAGFDQRVTNGGITSALVGVEATLLDGGLRDAEFAAARARLRSATAIEQQRRAEIAFATRSAYFTALAARGEERTRHEAIDTLRSYAMLLERQVGMGLAAHDEVLRAELAVKDAETARRAAATELSTAVEELGSLAGSPLHASALVEPAVMRRPVTPTPEAIDAAPIVADARAAVETARREADAVRSEQRGQLKLTADAGALGVPFVSTFRDHGGGQFLFGFAVPLFDGGVRASHLAAALATVDAAAAQMAESRRILVLGLERARAETERAEADVAAAQRAVPLAVEQFQLLRARYLGGGNVRLLEVLDALTQHVEARLGVPRAERAYRLAVATEGELLGRTAEP